MNRQFSPRALDHLILGVLRWDPAVAAIIAAPILKRRQGHLAVASELEHRLTLGAELHSLDRLAFGPIARSPEDIHHLLRIIDRLIDLVPELLDEATVLKGGSG